MYVIKIQWGSIGKEEEEYLKKGYDVKVRQMGHKTFIMKARTVKGAEREFNKFMKNINK